MGTSQLGVIGAEGSIAGFWAIFTSVTKEQQSTEDQQGLQPHSRGLEANLAIASSVISWHWSKVVVLFTALAVGLN